MEAPLCFLFSLLDLRQHTQKQISSRQQQHTNSIVKMPVMMTVMTTDAKQVSHSVESVVVVSVVSSEVVVMVVVISSASVVVVSSASPSMHNSIQFHKFPPASKRVSS